MQIDTHSPVRSTPSVSGPIILAPIDPSSGSFFATRWIANGKESLATSSDTASLQKAMMELACNLYLERLTVDAPSVSLCPQLFPMLVDETCFVPAKSSIAEDRARARLATNLYAAFEDEALEDGMYHPAERIIEEALQSTERERVLESLRELSLDATNPSLSADVLRCLARQEHPGSALWRTELVRDGLAMDSAEIRDAAVQAVEWWGDRDLRDVLQSHNEPVHWLRDYIREVIEDFGE
ncbi:MAG: hypothetical protein OXU79_19710 [Gemmatimonadota bacterium]|nr:hypothetical protein [Gemmatimonadota bacterium]